MPSLTDVLRKRLEDADTRELVQVSEECSVVPDGCPVCTSFVRYPRITICLNDDNSIYAASDCVCICGEPQ
jgi:hypothetical protein